MILPLDPAGPCVGDPDSLYEVVNGVKVVKEMGTYENVLAGDLFARIHAHGVTTGLGRAVVEVLFDLPNVSSNRRPDVAFISSAQWPQSRRPPRGNAWSVVPELAAEIVRSTGDTTATIEKVDEYFRAGVLLVWMVLPQQERVYVYTSPTSVRILSRGDELTGDPVLPGFRLPLADLFPPPDELPI